MAEIKRIQPEGLVDVRGFGFSQVVVARGGTHVHISGQVAVDAEGRTVGPGDLAAQTHQVMRNLGAALASVSATFDNVVRLGVFIVDYDPARRAQVLAVRNEYVDPAQVPASTLLGVQSLVSPDYLIEIEATAVID